MREVLVVFLVVPLLLGIIALFSAKKVGISKN
jgi:hypothetical protein